MGLPALLLLDLKMPGMSGFDTLCQIRTDDLLKKLPVVVITSSSLESDRTEAYASGADNYICKKIDMDQCIRDLKLVLEHGIKN